MKEAIRNTALITAIAVFLGAATVAVAGQHDCSDGAGAADRLAHRMDRMSHHLNLSDAQRAEIEVVLKGSESKMATLRKDLHDGRRALRQLSPEQDNFDAEVARLAAEQGATLAGLIELRAKTRAAIHPILTPEQRERAREFLSDGGWHKERKERHRSYM